MTTAAAPTTVTTVDSPIGPLTLVASGGALVRVEMDGQAHSVPPAPDWVRDDDDAVLAATRAQLEEYFAGQRTAFDLPLAPAGTPFQLRVWEELARIPYGTTISYGELAERVDSPGASRAVGLANGRNPLAIVVPCHRVIGASGRLTGYGGGLERKAWLLDHEAGRPRLPTR